MCKFVEHPECVVVICHVYKGTEIENAKVTD